MQRKRAMNIRMETARGARGEGGGLPCGDGIDRRKGEIRSSGPFPNEPLSRDILEERISRNLRTNGYYSIFLQLPLFRFISYI